MPVNDASLFPPESRLHLAMEALGTEVEDIVEEVRYFLRQPEEEKLSKVIYIEPGVSELVNESIESGQRSYLPFRVMLYGYIAESDTRVLADFINEVISELMSDTAISNYQEAFGEGDGFSIGGFENITPSFGEKYSLFSVAIPLMMHQH